MAKHTTRHRQTESRRYWEAHVQTQEKSGLSRAEYCRRHDLSYNALRYWRKKISVSPRCETTLVPVTLPQVRMVESRSPAQASLKITLTNRISIEVGDDFSPTTLVKLLTALEPLERG